MRDRQRLELPDQLRVPAESQLRVDLLDLRRQAELADTRHRVPLGAFEDDVRQRRAAPERECSLRSSTDSGSGPERAALVSSSNVARSSDPGRLRSGTQGPASRERRLRAASGAHARSPGRASRPWPAGAHPRARRRAARSRRLRSDAGATHRAMRAASPTPAGASSNRVEPRAGRGSGTRGSHPQRRDDRTTAFNRSSTTADPRVDQPLGACVRGPHQRRFCRERRSGPCSVGTSSYSCSGWPS